MNSPLKSISILLFLGFIFPKLYLAQSYSEGFENIASLTDWYVQNNSASPWQDWGVANSTVFPAQAGSDPSYLSVNYQSSSSTSATTLSNWLFTPTRTYTNGDVITFYTRTVAVTPIYPDRLELRFSNAGNGLDCGTTAISVGTFTNLLLTINPTLSTTGYPQTWTQYTVTISGLSGPTNGRVAFRYFVTNGGPGGANSNYIGIDSYTYTSIISPPANDDCAGAISLTQGLGCSPISGSVAYATESLVACSGTANNDVWYSFTANTTGAAITVNGTPFFDAVYEVYSGTCANLTSLACVDAGLEGEPEANVLNGLSPGTTYYIRVHDWLDDIPNTMNFAICVEQFIQCNLLAPAGSIVELESCGADVNGGCNATPPAFQSLACGDTIFGSAWATNGNRDLDWYSFQLNAGGNLQWSATAEFPFYLYIVDVSSCANPVILASANYNACQSGSVSFPLANPGSYAVVIAPSLFNGYPCGPNTSYIANLQLPTANIQVNTSATGLCVGDSVSLSAIGGSSYEWFLNDSLVATTNSWFTSLVGDYTVHYEDSNSCSAISDTLTLTPLPLSDASFSYPNYTVCAGSPNALPSSVNSGLFSAVPIGLTIDSTTGEIDILNSSAGTYTISFQTNQGCTNSSSQGFSITTSINADFSYDTTHFCNATPQEAIILGVNASSGIFTTAAGLSIDSQSGTIYPNTSQNGTYWVTNTVSGTSICLGSSDSILITIQGPQIQIQSPILACSGVGAVNLQGSPAGGVFSGVGVNGDTWNPAQFGDTVMINYAVQDATGCNATDSVLAISLVGPETFLGEIEPLCDTLESFVITNYSPSGGVFSGNGVSASGNINPNLLGPGSFYIVYSVTSGEGCVGIDSTVVTIVDCIVGIGELNASLIQVFPNPSAGEFSIIGEGVQVIKCWNTMGTSLGYTVSQQKPGLLILDLNAPAGTYFVELSKLGERYFVAISLY